MLKVLLFVLTGSNIDWKSTYLKESYMHFEFMILKKVVLSNFSRNSFTRLGNAKDPFTSKSFSLIFLTTRLACISKTERGIFKSNSESMF